MHMLFSALVILMAGCTGDYASPQDPAIDDRHDEQVIYSDIPIEFGCDPMVKVAMNELTDGMLFGIFPTLTQTNDLNVRPKLGIKDNMVLRYEEQNGFKFGYPSEDRIFFYPDSDVEYSFYAYYSYQNDSLIRAGMSTDHLYSTTRTRTYYHVRANGGTPRVIGTDGDVLWAKAKAYVPAFDKHVEGFNADIVRYGGKPTFSFEHPMARLYFRATLAEEAKDYLASKNAMIKVQQLMLMNSACEADLCLIDLEGDETLNMEGKFVNIQYSDQESKVPWLRAKDGRRSLECVMTPDSAGISQTLGKGEMVIVPQKESLVCRVILEYYNRNADGTYKNSRDGYWKYDIVLDPDDFIDADDEQYGNGYQAGFNYRYNIVVGFKYMTDINDGKQKPMPYVQGQQVMK